MLASAETYHRQRDPSSRATRGGAEAFVRALRRTKLQDVCQRIEVLLHAADPLVGHEIQVRRLRQVDRHGFTQGAVEVRIRGAVRDVTDEDGAALRDRLIARLPPPPRRTDQRNEDENARGDCRHASAAAKPCRGLALPIERAAGAAEVIEQLRGSLKPILRRLS